MGEEVLVDVFVFEAEGGGFAEAPGEAGGEVDIFRTGVVAEELAIFGVEGGATNSMLERRPWEVEKPASLMSLSRLP